VNGGRRFVAALTAAAAMALGLPSRAECRQADTTSPSSGTAPAQGQPLSAEEARLAADRETFTLRNVDVDLAVPESPAFTAIGLSPETIVRPATPREFATALLNGVDQRGHLQTGVAIDTAPYLVFAGSRVSLAGYRRSRATQILSRTLVSLATTKGATSDDGSVKVALGVHATLYDSEDPRLRSDALLQCFGQIDVFRPQALPVAGGAAEREKQEIALKVALDTFERTTLRPAADACREQFQRQARWNGTSWILAVAPSWVSPTGLAGDLGGGGLGIWTSLSYGFDGVPGLRDNAQIIGHVRHLSNEVVVDAERSGGQEVRDTTIAGARFRGGTGSFGLSFEAAYVRTAAAGLAVDTAARLALAAERRLAENVWMTIAFGGDRGADQGASRGLSVLSALKWGFAKDPTLTPDQLAALAAR
jgi:hypothetical protein